MKYVLLIALIVATPVILLAALIVGGVIGFMLASHLPMLSS